MNTHNMQKKAWRKDNQFWHVLDLTGGDVIASSPNQTWRGTVAEFKESFVDAREESTELVIEEHQTWVHIESRVEFKTISPVIMSRVMLENTATGIPAWFSLEELLNNFEHKPK